MITREDPRRRGRLALRNPSWMYRPIVLTLHCRRAAAPALFWVGGSCFCISLRLSGNGGLFMPCATPSNSETELDLSFLQNVRH